MAGRAPVIAAAIVAAGCNTVLGPSAPDKNWIVHDTARISLYTRPGSFADLNAAKIGEVLEDQYSYTLTILDIRFEGHVSGFLYDNGVDAGFATTTGNGDHSGTAYPDTLAFRAAAVPPLGENLYGLVNHEANHVFTRGGLGVPGTSFINEGLASAVISDRAGALGKKFLYGWTRDHRSQVPALSKLSDDGQWSSIDSNVAYNSSASFLAWAIDTYGAQRFKAIYSASSEQMPDRMRSAYGKSMEELEAEWTRFYTTFVSPP